MTTPPQTIAVLGGGIGGQVVATRLKERLQGRARVVIVERAPSYTFSPSLLWLMVGKRQPEAITRDYSRLLRRDVEVLHATVTGIDTEQSTIHMDASTLRYDYLVIALGAEHDPSLLPGAAEYAHHPYDLAAAGRLRDALAGFSGGRIVVSIASLPYRCPAAPYETAMLIDGYLRERGVREASTIDMYTPEPLPMPVAGPHAGYSVAAELAARSITFHARSAPTSVERQAITINGEAVPYDLAVVIPPHRPPAVIAATGLTGASGWVAVDRASLRTRAGNVYAIGDVTGIPLENGMMLPKAGVFAHGEAEVAAENIARRIEGDLREAEFDGHGTCFVEVGGGKGALARGDFFASPSPQVAFQRPGRTWHLGKVAFEQYWLRRWV
ncbi:MAG: FAD/NAD(P)-binding oxidoreductase [Dehalococcoidia bacterium]|nr:FAD/NAD(P)-binding oxidoreductase [Dehalococcoidia bacterium]